MHYCTVSSGYSATFFAAYKQRNSNSIQGIFMYEKFNREEKQEREVWYRENENGNKKGRGTHYTLHKA
jgi:hypothetical protein